MNFRHRRAALILRFGAAALLAAIFSGAVSAPAAAQTGAPPLPPGVSHTMLRVKFKDGTSIPAAGPSLPAGIAAQVSRVRPQFGLGKARLDALRANGKRRTGRDLPDLSLWYTVTLKPGADAASIVQELQALPEVETAGGAAVAAPPPTTPDFTSQQTYLSSLGAKDAWAYNAAGAGTGVTIYDVEYNWTTTHEDLSKAASAPFIMSPGDYIQGDYTDDPRHGTAVLGEMVANNNGFGVTGIAYNASLALVPVSTHNHDDGSGRYYYNLPDALAMATAAASPGDIILIEQQSGYVCKNSTYGPSETDGAVWDAIRTATDNGIVVVEAGGNGSQNLDANSCDGWFNPKHDSGAIMVGAGDSDYFSSPRAPEWFTSYGKRINVQAWGDSVTTTGWYGDISNNGVNHDADYTANFSGTSSASPMVAGLAADMQGLAKALRGEPLSPEAVRAILVSSGTPQAGTHHIGPQVNAVGALRLAALARPTAPSVVNGFTASGTPILRWQAIKGFADPYTIKLDDNADFSSTIVDTETTASSFKVPSPLPFGTYFWQIGALDVDGGSFEVTALRSPADNASVLAGQPRFTWNTIPGATQYTITITPSSGPAIVDTTTVPSYIPPAPLALDTYTWHIAATGGVTTGPTPDRTFVRTLIAAPKNGAPVATLTPKLAWQKITGATQYSVTIGDNLALVGATINPVNGTSLIIPLDYGRYYWTVAENLPSAGTPTPVSSFDVTALLSPKNGAVNLDTTPAFKWRAVAGAASYHLVVSTTPDPLSDPNPVIDASGLTRTSFTPSTPLPGRTTYYWQIVTDTGKTMPPWVFVEP